jgi:lipopolysaccharide transport protein LptA
MNNYTIINVFIIFVLSITTVNAEENYLNIDANHFEADNQKNILYFKGDVVMTKNKDVLLCQSLIINTEMSPTDKTKQIPKDYKATGNVSFTINTIDTTLKGKGDVVYYYPHEKKYIIIGNGFLEDKKAGKKITAEKIYIDELTGQTKIDGGKNKPIKFRLRLNEKNDSNTTKDKNEKS